MARNLTFSQSQECPFEKLTISAFLAILLSFLLLSLLVPQILLAENSPRAGLSNEASNEAVSGTVSSTTSSTNGSSANGRVYARQLADAFQSVARSITPSIVSISSKRKASKVPRFEEHPGLEPFRDFFGEEFFKRFIPPQGPLGDGDDGSEYGEGREGSGAEGGMIQQGLGTGVIIDGNGHIITNNHVIANADEVEVRLHDQRILKAKIVGRDAKTDLAVLKIEGTGLTPAVLGDSDKLAIGEWVVAAGNPFGLENSITSGIVSGMGRSIDPGNGNYEDYIQTDAAINPGNSGGPLLDIDGRVIGINTAIFSRTGGYMGIGFAIPINLVKNVMESLLKDGRVIRGWLGVAIQNLSPDLAKSFGYSGTKGSLVGDVQPDTPAYAGGMQQGDIITSFNGKAIENTNQLRNMVAATAPGSEVEVEVFRDKASKTLRIRIGELPADKESVKNGSSEKKEKAKRLELGLLVEPLTEESARALRSSQKSGLLVKNVQAGSVAATAGFLPRDIILSINGKAVKSIAELDELLTDKALQSGIRFVVESQGMQRFIFIRR